MQLVSIFRFAFTITGQGQKMFILATMCFGIQFFSVNILSSIMHTVFNKLFEMATCVYTQ